MIELQFHARALTSRMHFQSNASIRQKGFCVDTVNQPFRRLAIRSAA